MSKTRVVFGLAAAPIIPCAAFWAWIYLGTDEASRDGLLLGSLVSTGLVMCWFIGAGSIFLVWIGRSCGAVERFNCLALCATLTFFMPLIGAFINFGLESPGVVDGIGIILGSAIGGLFLAPLGVLGGWVLWRIAVRPATTPVQEMIDVF